jgi:ABC-2 type transport system ATP-binding protein
MESAVEIKNLVKVFRSHVGGRKVRAVDEVSISIRPGEVYGLIGPNGSGKSTTMKALLGLLAPTAGSCAIFGGDSLRVDSRDQVGFLPENPYFYKHLSGAETLRFFGKLCGLRGKALAARIDELLDLVELGDARDRRLGGYSKGMLQRIGLAQALIQEPRLLILDEPTVGIDPPAREAIESLLTRLAGDGLAVLMTSHDLAQLETLADSVAFLSEGRIAATGAPSCLIREFFGARRECRVSLADSPGAELIERLGELGLASIDRDALHWTGLIDEQPAWKLHSRLPSDAPITELRVRRPGLDSLWTRLYGRHPERVA